MREDEGGGGKNYPPFPHPYLRQAIAVYRTSTGAWYVYPLGGGAPYGIGWGGDAIDKPITTNLTSID